VEIDHVEAFLAIVRAGGFTRAAATLHLSQPAISRRIHLLERELGAPLFERLGSGLLLTDAGRAFRPHAEALAAGMRDALAAVAAVRGEDSGTVTLAVVGTLASSALTERLRRFREAHAGVDVRIRTALSTEVSALVRRGDAALGLRYGMDADPELVSQVVFDEPMVAVCSSRHPLARRRRVEAAALTAERWLSFPVQSGSTREPYASALERALATAGVPDPEIVPIDSLTAQKRMVEAGFGLALLATSAVEEEVRAGTLSVLRVAGLQATVKVVLIRRRRGFESGATRALAALLAAWPKGPARG